MDNVTNTLLVTGDVAVGRDITAGGNLNIKGETTLEHGLKVKGWIDAPNVKGPNKGVFESTDALNAAYPNPVTGWYAGVLVIGSPNYVECYYGKGGAWVDSGSKFEGASDYPQKANRALGGEMNGHLATLNGNGDLVDSGKTTADFATAAQGAKADTALQEHQDVSGKANKSEMSVVDGTGANADKTTITLKDGTSATVLKSHQDISGKQDVLTFDNSPTQGSNNPVKSGGVYSAINTLSGTVSTLTGKMNQLDAAVATAQGYKADAKDYRDDASGYKTDAQNAKIAAEAAQLAAQNAAAQCIAAAGLAVTDAVRVTFDFADTEKTLLCGSDDLLLMVVDGVGYANGYYKPSATGSKVVSFVFKDASEIPGNAFENNSLITALHIPSFVRNIGKGAFKGCSHLASVDCEAMTPPVMIGTDDISMSGVTLTVHGAVKSAYQVDDVKWKLATTIKTYEYNT